MLGYLSILGSIGIKFVTATTLPLFLFSRLLKSPKLLIISSAWIFLATLLIPIYQREPYPWYFIPFIGMVALSQNRLLKLLVMGISIGTLLRYLPFLYFGEYTHFTQQMQFWLTLIPFTPFIAVALQKPNWFE